MGVFLVAGNLNGNMRRLAGDGRLDALLVFAMAELDQRILVQPLPRYTPFFGRPDQRCSGRAQLFPLGEANEVVALFLEIEFRFDLIGKPVAQFRGQQA